MTGLCLENAADLSITVRIHLNARLLSLRYGLYCSALNSVRRTVLGPPLRSAGACRALCTPLNLSPWRTGAIRVPSEKVPRIALQVSPRNAERAAALAARFPQQVRIGQDNQDVVDRSDIVCIGVVPKLAEEVPAPVRLEHMLLDMRSPRPQQLYLVSRRCHPQQAARRASCVAPHDSAP